MPKPTFFRLEEEKQEKILSAAKKEFSTVPIHEVSIANIIKTADIPRGSFYQYFDGKDDVFFYLFDLLLDEPERYLLEVFEQTQGDLLESFNAFFDYFSEVVLFGEDALFYKNIFLHMDYRGSNRMIHSDEEVKAHTEHIHKHRKDQTMTMNRLYEGLNKKQLKIESEHDFKLLFKLILSIMFSSINEGYRMQLREGDIKIEEIKEAFHLKLSWLKYGVHQTKEEDDEKDN